MEIPLLYDIVVIFGLAIAVLFICHRFKIPVVVGFLITGVVVGPYGFGLVKAVHEVEILAEIGVVLLLFTIGIEFSLERLLQIKRSVLIGGSIQVLVTIAVTYGIAQYFGTQTGQAIFLGFLIALSSTAIVLKLLQERADVDSPHGRTTLGILIFQDIIIVPMILLTPLLAGEGGNVIEGLLIILAKGVGIIVLVIVSSRWIIPKLLHQIARTRSQEIFFKSVVVLCLGVAWLTSLAGLSLALGAFLAGLIISESEYSHQALGSILPFRDAFTSFFFVSIGMLLDITFLFQHPLTIVLITLGVLLGKPLIAGIATVVLGLPLRTAILVGIALGQVGEFSFILSRAGVEHGLLGGDFYQVFLAFAVLSMAATPFMIMLAPRIADAMMRLPLPNRIVTGYRPISSALQADVQVKDHLIIIGYGVNGRNVAHAARQSGIPYAIIEINPDTVRSEQERGEHIYYGDAAQGVVLEHVNINDARVVVVAINDPSATRRITEVVRSLNPSVHLIVRSRFLQEMEPLYKLGANDVIPEEFETSVEIFTRVLTKYLIPRDRIETLVSEIRLDGYEMFRSLSKQAPSFSNLQLPDLEISTLTISNKSQFDGKSLSAIDFRKKFGVTVVAIGRDSQNLYNPDVTMPLNAEDILYVLGPHEKVVEVARLCNESER